MNIRKSFDKDFKIGEEVEIVYIENDLKDNFTNIGDKGIVEDMIYAGQQIFWKVLFLKNSCLHLRDCLPWEIEPDVEIPIGDYDNLIGEK